MEALNVQAEFRLFTLTQPGFASITEKSFVNSQVRSGVWVEDDGDYYTREEWDAEEREAEEHEQNILRDQAEHEEREAAEEDEYWGSPNAW